MRPPTLAGTIARRILVNYRTDPDVVRPLLPRGFEPLLVDRHAIVGICLIELRLAPAAAPWLRPVRSCNGAHRFAVVAPDGRPAVYVPERHTDSTLVRLAGGRLFPGRQRRARIDTVETDSRLTVSLVASGDGPHVSVTGRPAEHLPTDSVFADPAAASAFFEQADTGYSDTRRPDRLDAVTLSVANWSTSPLAVERLESSYFDDSSRFPPGSIALDHALVMRGIHHSWHPQPPLELVRRPADDCGAS